MKTFSLHTLVPATSGAPGKFRRTQTWLSVKTEVLNRIRSGRWPEGAMIPTEHELAAELGCARATVNRALRELADSGILHRRRKVGTRVATQVDPGLLVNRPAIKTQIEDGGKSADYRLLESATVKAPAEVVEKLHLEQGTDVLYLVGLFTADSAPYCLEHRWMNLALFGDDLPDFSQISANEWLHSYAARTHGNMTIRSDVTTSHWAALDVAANMPLLRLDTDSWAGANPICLTHQFFPPGHQLHVQI